MKKAIYFVFLISFIFLFLFVLSYAHSGGTGSGGGHYDYSTGEYHYHHGKPAHQHTNGVCPYEQNNATTTNNNYSVGSLDFETEDNTKDEDKEEFSIVTIFEIIAAAIIIFLSAIPFLITAALCFLFKIPPNIFVVILISFILASLIVLL